MFTLAPSVIQIDSGELAAVQNTLGIAHPSGYPLFTMVGYLFQLLPLPFSKIYQANLLAALWTALGVVFFIKAARLLLPQKAYLPAIFGGLLLAFSKTIWFQSTSVEVYSLHIFLLNLIIYYLLKAFLLTHDPKGKSKEERQRDRKKVLNAWLKVALCLGLAFSNHLTTLLILPGVAVLFFIKEKFSKRSFKILGLMLVLFFMVLALIYAYLPIRSSMDPDLNWGHPVTVENFFRHLSGQVYSIWMFSSMEVARKQMGYFLSHLPGEFVILGLLVGILGMFVGWKHSKKLSVFLGVTFLITVFYGINYEIHDIDAYFILAYICMGFFMVYGLNTLMTKLDKKTQNKHPFIIVGIVMVIVMGVGNFSKVDQSRVHLYEDYTRALLAQTETDALVLSYQWDYFISASYYFQKVENFRKDVVIIDKELLRRTWYYHQLKTDSPEVIKDLEMEIQGFIQAVTPFERDEKYDAAVIQQHYSSVISGFISTHISKRPVYLAPEFLDKDLKSGEVILPKTCRLVPVGFLFQVVEGNQYVPASPPDYTFRIPKKTNRYTDYIQNTVGNMLVNRAMYEKQWGKVDKSNLYIQKIKKDLPNYTIQPQFKSLLGLGD